MMLRPLFARGTLFGAFAALIGPAQLMLAGAVEPAQIAPAESPDSRFQFVFIEENANLGFYGSDRHFTNVAQASLLSPQLTPGGFANSPIRWLGKNTPLFLSPNENSDDRFEWLILGQAIFTPEDHHLSNPSTSDRPYAGWLYTGIDLLQNQNDQVLTSLQMQAGVVGSYALARQTQNAFHSLIGDGLVRGWRHQLSNQFGFVVTWNRNWRFPHELGDGFSWEVVPTAGLALGNVYTYAQAGGLLRWGRGLEATWGPDLFPGPGFPGTAYFDPRHANTRWGFDLYGGAVGRLMAVNVFLDGNTLQNSRSVAKEIPVGDLLIGAEVFWADRFRVGFTSTLRSPEFNRQRGPDTFGGVHASFFF